MARVGPTTMEPATARKPLSSPPCGRNAHSQLPKGPPGQPRSSRWPPGLSGASWSIARRSWSRLPEIAEIKGQDLALERREPKRLRQHTAAHAHPGIPRPDSGRVDTHKDLALTWLRHFNLF